MLFPHFVCLQFHISLVFSHVDVLDSRVFPLPLRCAGASELECFALKFAPQALLRFARFRLLHLTQSGSACDFFRSASALHRLYNVLAEQKKNRN